MDTEEGRRRPLADLLEAIAAWAAADPRIAAVALVGSHARGSARPDSDVDLLILSDVAEQFVADTGWLRRLGRHERHSVERWGRVRSVRVFYAGGDEIEFGFAKTDWAASPLDPGSRRVVEAGFQPLFDRAGILGVLGPSPCKPAP